MTPKAKETSVTTHQQQTAHQKHLQRSNLGPDRSIRTAICGDPIQELLNHPQLVITQYKSLLHFLNQDFSTTNAAEPELIVITQNFSDQFCPTEIDQLLSKHPISRILSVYGPLSVSDGRTRDLWPHSLRIPHWKLSQRIEQELAVLTGNAPAIPLTATREETAHFELQSLSAQPHQTISTEPLIVFSPDATWTELIADSWSTLSNSSPRSKCHQIHTLGKLDRFLNSSSKFTGKIILDIDPLTQDLKEWLHNQQLSSQSEHIEHSSPQNSCDDILQFPTTSHLNAQIIAVSNWLLPHRQKELEQLGIKQYLCKLNLSEILTAVSH